MLLKNLLVLPEGRGRKGLLSYSHNAVNSVDLFCAP